MRSYATALISAPDPKPISSASERPDNRPDMAMNAPRMSDEAPTNAQKPAAPTVGPPLPGGRGSPRRRSRAENSPVSSRTGMCRSNKPPRRADEVTTGGEREAAARQYVRKI